MAQKKRNKLKIMLIVVLCIMFAILFSFIGIGVVRVMGKNSLKDVEVVELPSLHKETTNQLESQTEEVLKPGQVSYQNKVYEYNEDLLTFLCLGVDSRQAIQLDKTPGKGGQADTIILVVLDEVNKTLKMVNLSRDAIVNVEVYDENGIYNETVEEQIALQYAYGDGKEKSCELMVTVVSDVFYGIPIHGYGAIDVNAVADLNDAIGGVEVTVIEDLSRFTDRLALGNTITLSGREALHYVQERDVYSDELGANNLRIERQKQYLMQFFNKAISATKEDLGVPVTLYDVAIKNMVTDITVDEMVYLSTLLIDTSFSEEDMMSVLGTVEKNGNYEEFIIDEDKLFDLMIEVFYREVS